MRLHRKIFLGGLAVFILFSILFIIKLRPLFNAPPPIKVGVLFSLTGTMSISEKPVADAVLLAIDEVNKNGGILGSRVIPILADGKSDPEVFQDEAARLITENNVKAIFGCWTSASRKAVKPIVEKYNSLLFYPVQYEGMEQSPNIVYLGPTPNQQLIPAVKWGIDRLGKRFFLVGSDYIFPRIANAIARDAIIALGGEVVGEEYAPIGSQNLSAIIEKISSVRPDAILNTINGDSNIAFFENLRKAKTPKIPVISLSITENEIKIFQDRLRSSPSEDAGANFQDYLAGTYACWAYFESIEDPLNADLIKKFTARYGKEYKVTDPVISAYFSVILWSKAANECKNIDNPFNVVSYLHRLSLPTPKGVLTIAGNNHARQTPMIGKLNDKGVFEVVWASPIPIDPVAYPPLREKETWDALIEKFYEQWNRHWAAPSAKTP